MVGELSKIEKKKKKRIKKTFFLLLQKETESAETY